MPLYFRRVSRAKWDRERAATLLAAGDVPADCLGDLRTTGNGLSIWQVDDDGSELGRVVGAFASLYEKAGVLDYCLLPPAVFQAIGLVFEQSDGNSRDTAANASMHFDLVNLSGAGLIRLAQAMFAPEVKMERLSEKVVIGHVVAAIKAGRYSVDQLAAKLREKVAPLLKQ